MRRLLRVSTIQPDAVFGARSALRRSVVISGVRCTITYLLVPILVPVFSFMGAFAAPLSITLCLYAMGNGVVSVRRFWMADHRAKWKYTGFIGVVFGLLVVAIAMDMVRWVGG